MDFERVISNNFEDVIGQEYAIKILISAIKKDKLSNAYLFSGPHGVGRRKTALRFIECIFKQNKNDPSIRSKINNLNHPDILVVEPTYLIQGNLVNQSQANFDHSQKKSIASIRLEQIRNIRDFLGKKPLMAEKGIVLIEDLEQINESAANALLKTLEEPNHGMFILISERPERLLDTIRSRCQVIPFTPLKNELIEMILRKELQNKLTARDLISDNPELIKLSSGSPGKLLQNIKIWDDISEELRNNLNQAPNNYLDALHLAKDITSELNIEQQIWIINWLQTNIWEKENNRKSIQRLELLRNQISSSVQPRLAWEIALLEIYFFN